MLIAAILGTWNAMTEAEARQNEGKGNSSGRGVDIEVPTFALEEFGVAQGEQATWDG